MYTAELLNASGCPVNTGELEQNLEYITDQNDRIRGSSGDQNLLTWISTIMHLTVLYYSKSSSS